MLYTLITADTHADVERLNAQISSLISDDLHLVPRPGFELGGEISRGHASPPVGAPQQQAHFATGRYRLGKSGSGTGLHQSFGTFIRLHQPRPVDALQV